jgi:Glu-tRNA(Gln) amidotransferase subunit E-like FAD-binding protein
MKYTIIDFNEEIGQISVNYTEENLTIGIDLPTNNGLYPEGEELNQLILNSYPYWYVEKRNQAKTISNKQAIKDLVKPLFEDNQAPPNDFEQELEKEALLREEIETIVKQVLQGIK